MDDIDSKKIKDFFKKKIKDFLEYIKSDFNQYYNFLTQNKHQQKMNKTILQLYRQFKIYYYILESILWIYGSFFDLLMDKCISASCGFPMIGEKLLLVMITFYNQENLQIFSYISIYENLFNSIFLYISSEDRQQILQQILFTSLFRQFAMNIMNPSICSHPIFYILFILINIQIIDVTNSLRYVLYIIFMQWTCTTIFCLILQKFFELQLENKKVEGKNLILNEVNHEQRAQLNGIGCCIKDIIAETQKEIFDIDIIYKSALKIKQMNEFQIYLVSDFLDSNRILMNTFSLNNRYFNLQQIVDEVIDLLKFKAKVKQTQIYSKVELENLQIYSDPQRIKQILINLLGNSIKFTQKGEIILYITLYGDNIIFTIRDNGLGIPQKYMKLLGIPYQTFQQATDKDQDNNQGTGLGISISQQLLRQLGPLDKFFIQSKENEGTQITFLLFKNQNDKNFDKNQEYINQFYDYCRRDDLIQQLRQVKQNPNATFQELVIPDEGSAQKLKSLITGRKDKTNQQVSQNLNYQKIIKKIFNILISDDNCFNTFAIKNIITQYDFDFEVKITTCIDGQEAVQIFQENNSFQSNNNIHMIIMDFNMIFMNGDVACQKINEKINNGFQKCVIVGHSSDDTQIIKDAFLRSGAKYFLIKPPDNFLLQEMIKESYIKFQQNDQ